MDARPREIEHVSNASNVGGSPINPGCKSPSGKLIDTLSIRTTRKLLKMLAGEPL